MNFEPELGQLLKDDTYEQHEATWAINGLQVIADKVDPDNYGYGVHIDTPVFTMRMYNWEDCICDEDAHKPDCPDVIPHFYHKESGLGIRWYKYIGRGMGANQLKPDDWEDIVARCVLSIKKEG